MEDDPWKGYFPIPNNHNKDRLFYEIGKISSPFRYVELDALRTILFDLPEELLYNAFFSYSTSGRSKVNAVNFVLKWQNTDTKELTFRLDNITDWPTGKLLFSEFKFVESSDEFNPKIFTVLQKVAVHKIKEDNMSEFIKIIKDRLTNG